MNCREFVDFLMEYLDGNLAPGEKEVFEQHLADCPPCVVYVDTYRETVRLGADLLCEPEGAPPEDVPEALVTAILAARSRR